MLKAQKQKPIPKRLSHHTNMQACKSILSDTEGKGICFWVVSNRYKNDDHEIKMGEYMLKRVREAAPSLSLLQKFGGYENSASLSFMEGESTLHMLKEYGYVRLDFDLRKRVELGPLAGGFMNCEYVAYDELKEYADDYCKLIRHTLNSVPKLQEKYGRTSGFALNAVVSFLMMENDIMYKVFTIKEIKWQEEQEWRQVLQLKEDDPDLLHTSDCRPYKKFYLPKESLTGITLLYAGDHFENSVEKYKLERFLLDKGYHVPVNVQKVE